MNQPSGAILCYIEHLIRERIGCTPEEARAAASRFKSESGLFCDITEAQEFVESIVTGCGTGIERHWREEWLAAN
jgi:hypothetical protein